MIRMFCRGLPRSISQLLYNEYQYKEKELHFLVSTYTRSYTWIENIESIKLLLAMSIYYRRVIAQLEAATDFTNRIFKGGGAQGVLLGGYNLNSEEVRILQTIVKEFNRLLYKYGIVPDLFDYGDVKTFLYNVKAYVEHLETLNEET